MKTRLLTAFAFAALAVASAKTYSLTLFQASVLGGKELKPGSYKVELVDNNKVVLRGEKLVSEAAVTVQTTEQKFNGTSVRFANADGKYKIQEILLGGTRTKLIVAD